MTYVHDGDKYEVTVGQPRKRYPRKTGPRGGYIKNADFMPWGSETGNVVTRIEVAGNLIHVWSEEPSRGWANPSFVGRDEVKAIEYITLESQE